MIRIKLFCSFAPSEKCIDVFERINYANEYSFYGKDKTYMFTVEENYTHAIIINNIMPKLNIPKENVLGLAFEPPFFLRINASFIQYAQKHIGRYFIGDKGNLPDPFIEHFAYMWHSRPTLEIPISSKKNIMSIIVSEKKQTSGHQYRHKLIEQIIAQQLPIDIYGRGSHQYKYDRIYGKFNDAEPYESYYFSVCIENMVCNHYFSEKIITPLMYNCVPIYFGCKQIAEYVENTIFLQGNIQADMNLIVNILKNPDVYYKPTFTEKNKGAVNLIQHLPELFPVVVK
jgi:hypothetical protein